MKTTRHKYNNLHNVMVDAMRRAEPLRTFLVLSLLLLLVGSMSAQSAGWNYVMTVCPLEGSVSEPSTDADMSRVGITYFDGLGREVQQVAVGQGGDGEDIVTLTEYDRYGNAYRDWLATPDPLAEQYPDLSPYSHCANNPLTIVDPDGMRLRVQDGDKYYYYHYDEDGYSGFYEETSGEAYNGDNEFIASLAKALTEISTATIGKEIINELVMSDNLFIFSEGNNEFIANSHRLASANLEELQIVMGPPRSVGGSGGTISWSPSNKFYIIDQYENCNSQKTFLALFHEMAHASDANNGLLYYGSNYNSYQGTYEGLKKSEWRAVYRENLFRIQRGLPLRKYYGVDGSGPGCEARGVGPRLLDSNNTPINYPPYY